MKINESYGIVTNENVQWEKLCNLICQYIFDLHDGMVSNPLYDEDNQNITLDNINSYYNYKYYKNISNDILPNWIGDFIIILLKNKNDGIFYKSEAKLNNEQKLNIKIVVKDSADKGPDEITNILVHEFRHAYTTYLELTNKFKVNNKKEIKLYNKAQNQINEPKYNIKKSIIKYYDKDYLILDNDIYTNLNLAEQTILLSFYYTDTDEINSFLQEFDVSMKRLINSNKEQLKADIEESNSLKNNYLNRNISDQWKSNILNNLSITCYDNQYFRKYKALQQFWNGIQAISEEDATIIYNNLKQSIHAYFDKSLETELIKFSGDAQHLLKKIAENMLKIINKMINKMQRIYFEKIMQLKS